MTSIVKLVETAMSTPTWTTGANFYVSTTINTPFILGVSLSSNITVLDRNFASASLGGSVGDGNIYTYALGSGAFQGSSLQSAGTTQQKNWSLWSDNWAAVGKDHGGGSYTRPYYLMATSDGNHVLYGPDTLALNSGYPSSPVFVAQVWSVCAALPSWTNFHSAYPCADFGHILVMGKTATSGNFPGVWAVVQVTGGTASVTSNGTVTDGQTINSFGANFTGGSNSMGFNNPGNPNGCLQSDLQTLWLANTYAHAGEIMVLQIQGSSLVTLAGQTGTVGSPAGTQAFPVSSAAAPANTPLSIWADNGYAALTAGQELAVWTLSTNLGTVVQFDANASLMPYQWRSKEYLLDHPTVFRYCQVKAGSFAQTKLLFWADGVNYYTTTVTSENPFALPDGPNNAVNGNGYQRFMIEVHGTDSVRSIQVAESIEELI